MTSVGFLSPQNWVPVTAAFAVMPAVTGQSRILWLYIRNRCKKELNQRGRIQNTSAARDFFCYCFAGVNLISSCLARGVYQSRSSGGKVFSG